MRLYYLTTRAFGLQDIQRRRTKISRFESLNDLFEMHPVHLGDKLARKVWGEFATHWGQRNGLLCFTETWQSPVMWAHYGERHHGLCLGFDVQDDLAEQVRYRATKLRFALDPARRQFGVTNEQIRQVLLTKHLEWKPERERRILLPLAGQHVEGGLHFRPWNRQLVLREVLLGARCDLRLEDVAKVAQPSGGTVSLRRVRAGFSKFRMEHQLLEPEILV